MALFEVAIHNSIVRQKVKNGERHPDLSDDWADTHFIEIRAHDVEEARRRILNRYPKHAGYIINEITLISG